MSIQFCYDFLNKIFGIFKSESRTCILWKCPVTFCYCFVSNITFHQIFSLSKQVLVNSCLLDEPKGKAVDIDYSKKIKNPN